MDMFVNQFRWDLIKIILFHALLIHKSIIQKERNIMNSPTCPKCDSLNSSEKNYARKAFNTTKDHKPNFLVISAARYSISLLRLLIVVLLSLVCSNVLRVFCSYVMLVTMGQTFVIQSVVN